MRTADLTTSSSIAALTTAFLRGPRIAFAPETGTGGGAVPARKPDAVPKRDAARKDEGAPPEGDDKMDRLLSALQSITEGQTAINARLDALEAKGKDASAKGADDPTEEEQEEIAKNDGAGPSMIEREMGVIKGRMTYAERQRADAARDDVLARIQGRADSAFSLHGKRAPAPMAGEGVMAYRVRVLRDHQRFSEAFKGVDLGALAKAGDATFGPVEDRIFADSAEAANRPEGPEDGSLMVRERFDKDMQRNVREYFGRNTYAKLMSPVSQRFQGFRIQPQAA